MKACKLCGAEYSERINFCFNDGEVLAVVGAGAVSVLSDPLAVPNPGQIAPAMPPTHVARTPVPRQRSLVNQAENASEGLLAQRPPKKPEPDDFTPRPLQTLAVDPTEGPAEPVYSPPAGMDLDDGDPAPTPVPELVVAAMPTSAPPEPAPPPVVTPRAQPIDQNTSSSLVLLAMAAVGLVVVMMFLAALFMGFTLSGTGEQTTSLAEAIPSEPVETVVEELPELVEEPDEMDIPTPDPLDLGLPAEPVPAPYVEPEIVPVASPKPAPKPDAIVEVVQPVPDTTEADPWATRPEPTEPQPVSEGRVAFSSTPSGAELIIDGLYRGATPITQVLPFGEYEVTMRLPGHVSQRETLSVTTANADMAATLPKIEMAKALFQAPGRDGDTLFVDGRPIGTLPREVELKPGAHIFTVEGPGGPRLSVTREVTMNDTKIVLR